MNHRSPALVLALLGLSACVLPHVPETEAARYPFVGTWDCEVATFAFTANSYNNGAETLLIESITQAEGSYLLGFADGYSITLDMDGADRMQWLSGATGDAFNCTRL